ncbi:MAG: hypothetical protein NTZ40_12275 [Cyanobacteria bacterium]|nr:hypothetical protein [Cyanobacteriota bacterium]
MKNKFAVAAVVAIFCAPAASFAGTSADINASGTASSFCDISNTGGPISLSISANKDKLSGTSAYAFTANGDAFVSLSALTPSGPQGAAAFTPSVNLANLVASTSSTQAVDGAAKTGVNKLTGAITTEIIQNNSSELLSAGAYSLATTATCTAL